MKLKLISEIAIDPNTTFNYLGAAAKNVFNGRDKLPERFRQHKMEQVSYERSQQHNVKCATCEFFNAKERSCLVVEGVINPEAVCDMWKSDNIS